MTVDKWISPVDNLTGPWEPASLARRPPPIGRAIPPDLPPRKLGHSGWESRPGYDADRKDDHAGKRFTEEQIIAALKEAEAGAKTADLCRRHGVSDQTFYRWKTR